MTRNFDFTLNCQVKFKNNIVELNENFTIALVKKNLIISSMKIFKLKIAAFTKMLYNTLRALYKFLVYFFLLNIYWLLDALSVKLKTFWLTFMSARKNGATPFLIWEFWSWIFSSLTAPKLALVFLSNNLF